MGWIIVAVVLAAAVGPLLWLLPSKRDRRLSELRTAARSAGLIVEVASVPKLDARAEERVTAGGAERLPSVSCAAYALALPAPLPDAPLWRLLKSERENRYLSGWTTLSPPKQTPTPAEGYWRTIQPILDAMPGGCVAVEAGSRRIAWLGTERIGEDAAETIVADIHSGLSAIAELHRELDAAARPGG